MLDWMLSTGKKVAAWVSRGLEVADRVFGEVKDVVNLPPLSDQYKTFSRDMDVIALDTLSSQVAREGLARQRLERNIQKLEGVIVRTLEENEDFKYSVTQKLEMVRLGLEASAIDRHVQSLAIHAANLSVHLQTISNIAGICDDVDTIRGSLRGAISTINHIGNILERANLGKVRRMSGFNIEMKRGVVSIKQAHDEFEKCRLLLERAALQLKQDIAKHLRDVASVREEFSLEPSYGESIVYFLDEEIRPQLQVRSDMVKSVLGKIRDIPVLELPNEVPAESNVPE